MTESTAQHEIQPILLRLAEVQRFLRIARTTIHTLLKQDPTFPRPVQITGKAIGWRREELEEWANNLPPARTHSPAPDQPAQAASQ